MKPVATYQKLRGGYYSPKPIADFLAHWVIQTPTTQVLEPSCGDGILLESAFEALIRCGSERTTAPSLVHGIELDPQEAQKASERLGVLISIASLPSGGLLSSRTLRTRRCKALGRASQALSPSILSSYRAVIL